jgi:hypothetical protein
MNANELPPTAELFGIADLVARHPGILNESRVRWAVRRRQANGLADAVFETRGGELLIREPDFLRWFLGLSGRAKPRAQRRTKKR